MTAQPFVDFGAEICGSLDAATEREWLVTNGLGGYASGTISGILTRRYHGLLVAALQVPGGRTLLVSKLDETLSYDGRSYELGANRWVGGEVAPEGFHLLERFRLEGTTPVWTFACGDALIEKRVWMQDGANTTFVRYDLARAATGTAEIEIKALVNYRDFHATTETGNWQMEVTPAERGLRVLSGEAATPFYLLSDSAQAEPRGEWYRNFYLDEEHCRGLGDHENHFLAGIFRARLALGRPVTLVLTTESKQATDARAALAARAGLEDKLLEYWVAARPQGSLDAPPWIRQLVLAASQFVVRRPLEDEPDAHTILAGYPWFGEWSRDTMIALPGLLLETGRPDLARSILRHAAHFLAQGMLPNVFPERFPDASAGVRSEGGALQYNSVDATLWYFEALRQYYVATSDKSLIGELYPQLAEVIERHVSGTRYGIRVDEADGLLHAGEPGVQLTWMDAKVGDQVVTPRIGKPVEVNALWYNALRTMSRFTFELDKPPADDSRMAERVQKSVARFWNAEAGCCFDVIDGDAVMGGGGNDASVRPNQILAVSLPESPLPEEQRRGVVDVCARRLITSFGLRTLDPADPRYRGVYSGSPAERDSAYHQGTVWAWLLGSFVLAHLRVYRDPALAFTFLEPMARNLLAYGVGSIGEIFDGDAPFQSRGAIAQAWSVAEVLRAWHACHEAGLPVRQIAVAK